MGPCDNFSMTSTLVKDLARQLLKSILFTEKIFIREIAPVNGLAYKLDKFYSSPGRSIPLFSLSSLFYSQTVPLF